MGHFYTKDGQPCHYQPDGTETTLRHARKQDLVPSVTGILDIIDKPGLTRYLVNQHIQAAWERGIGVGADYPTWCANVREMASKHSMDARDAGLAVHNAIEKAYLGKEVPDEHLSAVAAVSGALTEKYGNLMDNPEPEKTFATEDYGGTVDLVTDGLIIDFKRKADGWEKKKNGDPKKVWYVESHAAQLIAYRDGLDEGLYRNGIYRRCVNVFISPENEVYIHEWSEEDLLRGQRIFQAALMLWKAVKNFRGGDE